MFYIKDEGRISSKELCGCINIDNNLFSHYARAVLFKETVYVDKSDYYLSYKQFLKILVESNFQTQFDYDKIIKAIHLFDKPLDISDIDTRINKSVDNKLRDLDLSSRSTKETVIPKLPKVINKISDTKRRNNVVKDHLGNEYNHLYDMCQHYNINVSTYNSRIKMGWDIKTALTTLPGGNNKYRPFIKKGKACADHLGNQYNSKKEMCNQYGITVDTFNKRISIGYTLERALTQPINDRSSSVCKSFTDHLGNTYPSIKAACNHYGIEDYTFRNRLKCGWSIEKALTAPKYNRIELESVNKRIRPKAVAPAKHEDSLEVKRSKSIPKKKNKVTKNCIFPARSKWEQDVVDIAKQYAKEHDGVSVSSLFKSVYEEMNRVYGIVFEMEMKEFRVFYDVDRFVHVPTIRVVAEKELLRSLFESILLTMTITTS